MIEMININSFYESKNNFCLIKRESSNKNNMVGERDEFQWERYCKMFSLKRFLVSKCILIIDFFCQSLWNQDQGHVLRKCIPRKSLNRLVFGMLYLHIFLITLHEIDTAAKVYLQLFQTYMIELFCENSYQFLALNSNKSTIRENWHDSKCVSQLQRFQSRVFDIIIKMKLERFLTQSSN